ncbi:hypothetical protein GCM10023185_37770 [Hymenobacter saemangeumensis]|uniref:DUF2157 domain-containing protein n=1 Tax=Hymenobacter saemangeumensis TaxID=1084522 RepID=A0ABP8IQT2_9BACT
MPSDHHLLPDLEARGLLPPEQAATIAAFEQTRPFSLHYELRATLYFGITLLTAGLGVLIYQNIEHIGHGVVIGLIALLTLACFAYATRYRQAFTWQEAPKAGVLPDYVLLLGCLTFLILEGYLQYQYEFFGTRYGLATILPALLFFPLAYAFDHRGVLSMAITALAAWVGVSVAPLSVLSETDFFHSRLGGAALALGLLLMGAGLYSEYQDRKRHFGFTYLSLGSNLALLTATAMLLNGPYGSRFSPGLLCPLILALSCFLVWYARRTHSYLFLLMGIIYSYIVLTYGFFQLIDVMHSGEGVVFLALLYFAGSAVSVVLLFINIRKILGIHGS